MQLYFKPFEDFIDMHTSPATRQRSDDVSMVSITINGDEILARVLGTMFYEVSIHFNKERVVDAQCTCPYDHGGFCKHIVRVLTEADRMVSEAAQSEHTPLQSDKKPNLMKNGNTLILADKHITALSAADVRAITAKGSERVSIYGMEIEDAQMPPNAFIAYIKDYYSSDARISITQNKTDLHLHCDCANRSSKICKHLKFTLLQIIGNGLYQLAFNEEKRHKILKDKAKEYGLEDESNPDNYFEFVIHQNRCHIISKHNLLPLSTEQLSSLENELVSTFQLPKAGSAKNRMKFILAEESYNGDFKFYLMEAPLAKNGNIKSPIVHTDLQELAKSLTQPEEFLFITALMQNSFAGSRVGDDLEIIKNPLKLPFYYHKSGWNVEKITPRKIDPVEFTIDDSDTKVKVVKKDGFYVMALEITIDGKTYGSEDVDMSGNYIKTRNKFHYIKNESTHRVLSFFTEVGPEIHLTPEQFTKFKSGILDKLEKNIKVEYSFIKKAPKALVKKEALDQITEHLIYLSESEDYILITPVMRYGEVEAPILSRQNVYAEDKKGKLYIIERNADAELRFQRNIQKLHPEFEDDPPAEFYYLHKQKFLDDGWFIEAFEEWRKHGYSILGFSQLKNNTLNPHKMSVSMSVNSGIDWFDIETDVSFGEQKVGLKEIRKSVLNKSRFVKLGDGTKGLLPEEWVEKFSRYFRSGEIKDGAIRTHKSHFGLIDELFEKEILSSDVKMELENYREKLANFHSIRNVKIPKKLKATLRDYQKEGLNWLHFLDEFGFGGCLADDMGLGKTVQLLAYFLSQIEQGNKAPNLVIVPTSLLFNWELEIKKFAPKLKYKIAYGVNRDTKNIAFAKYNVILTTYGTMMNDVQILRETAFNVIVLDESQAIKNPGSKRYKAARLLQGRQKIVATGTPVENNTFDLYAQLSFALPGLFGGAKRFATDYSTPIDKFQDEKRAAELQEKVRPFILRRTKKEVATELPEKTEMIVHCEMGKEQRRVYDTYKKEFQQFLKNKNDDELKTSSMHILQGLTKMRQICNSPALLSDNEYYGSQSAKLDELTTQIQKLQEGHKILVFSQFVTMLDLIKERLDKEDIKYAYLTGKTRKRQEQVDRFQEDENVRVFLISLKAGGTGLNLTEAEYVFIVDPWWNPAVENQAIDRAYRIGQSNKVIAIRLITPDTIEEKIAQLQDRKKKLVEDLISTDSGFFKQLTKDDLMKIV